MDTGRTAMLIGQAGVNTLAAKRVAVFGVGGVGGAVCETLVRAGIGALDLIDDDVVSASNLNRQVVALQSTIGQAKVAVMAARAADINPACAVRCYRLFYTPATADAYDFAGCDYAVDAVDTVSAKLEIISRARAAGVPVISAMGAGGKLHPECFEVAAIEHTSCCPLARVMRKELKRRGIAGVKVVYSREAPLAPGPQAEDAAPPPPEDGAPVRPEDGAPVRPGRPKAVVPGSISFVPAAAGLVLAGAVVRDLLGLG